MVPQPQPENALERKLVILERPEGTSTTLEKLRAHESFLVSMLEMYRKRLDTVSKGPSKDDPMVALAEVYPLKMVVAAYENCLDHLYIDFPNLKSNSS